MKLLKWAKTDIWKGDNTDLWLLLAAALIFTVLGATGIASTTVLSSVVLALLGLVAVSQIRSRQQVSEALATQRSAALSLLESDFPQALFESRGRTQRSYMFVGTTMSRTLPTSRQMIERLLQQGGHVRVLLPNPANTELVRMVSASRRVDEGVEPIRSQIATSLSTLDALRKTLRGSLELRVTEFLPRIGLNLYDVEDPTGLVIVQHYEFKPTSEAAPIFALTQADGPWYGRFAGEAERLWENAAPWP